ncbi:MAG: hypothetical protein IKI44_01375 [Bacteroidaceae bacterium]|nr:hypothetical protein [Bacteroidaceae bacterium]
MKEHKGRSKRRVPAITLPKVKAVSYALVLARNPHREHFASILGIMDFTVFPNEIRAKDEPHAFSLFARIMFAHIETGLSSWQATSEPVAELQQKTRSAGLRDKSFGKDGIELVSDFHPACHGLS